VISSAPPSNISNPSRKTPPKEPKKTVRQLLLDADIKVVTDCSSDDDALSKGTAAINDATAVLQGWVRNPSGGVSGRDAMLQMLMNRNAGGGGFGFGGGFDALRMPLNIDNELNSTYHITKLDELFQCPIALEKVGMRGMYHLMKLADNNVLIYPEEAQMMASALERAICHAEGDGGDEDDYNEDSALKGDEQRVQGFASQVYRGSCD
ncbi:hypothetical protein BT96DRAFT_924397, partial [Gymnopus androsaceus JB14]